MNIEYDVFFGVIRISFQLSEPIVIIEKSMKSVLGDCKSMLGFSYLAIPTRHQIRQVQYM